MLGAAPMAVAAAMTLATASSGSTPSGRLMVVVAVDGDEARQIAARVEGQTTEFDVALVLAEVGRGLAPDDLEAAARAAAEARGSAVAVWFVAEPGGWVVNVARGDRTIRRLVAESKGALSSSSSIEAVAMVVRSSLRGVVTAEPVADRPRQETAAPPPAAPPPPPLLFAEFGWTAVMDRAWSTGHHGFEARVTAGVNGWQLGLLFEEHPPERLATDEATVQLERQLWGLTAARDLLVGPRWRVDVGVVGELLRFLRVTTRVADGLVATPPQNGTSVALRPELDIGFRVVWFLYLHLRVGVECLANWPQLAIRQDGVTHTVAALWWVQPTASLSLKVAIPVPAAHPE